MMFSIVIPTYNRSHIIGGTVRSVLAQTFQDFEVIVVDDGSTDNTKTIFDQIADKRVSYWYKPNEERSVARNFGAERAKGRYLIFLDSDDKFENEHLESIHHYLEANTFQPRFLFTGYRVYSASGKVLYQYQNAGIFKPVKLLYGNSLGCSPVVIEKKLFLEHRFNISRDLILFEDWELWLRLISVEALYCIPSTSVLMTNHDGRSVLNYCPEDLEKKAIFFRSLATLHSPLVRSSRLAKRRFNMGVYSYIALHIALSRKKSMLSLRYLAKSFLQDPGIILRRRFFGIIKQLL